MQEIKGIRKYWPILIVTICILITYSPILFQLFALKNDALTDNFPQKFLFSKSLNSNSLPIWNPFINHGIPLYADPGFAYWHPITWLMGLIGYSVPLLSIETIIYILIGGISTYHLGKALNLEQTTCIAMGILYACSGFMVANLQYTNFLTGAAFLPFCFSTYYKWRNTLQQRYAIQFGLSVYLLLAGGHPALPISLIYFFLITILYTSIIINKSRIPTIKKNLLSHIPLLLYAFLFSLPIVYSSLEIIPYLNRSTPVDHALTNQTGFSLPSYLSFIFPFATNTEASYFTDNMLFRNSYLSITGIILFFFSLFKKHKSVLEKYILTLIVLFLILSSGGIVKSILYTHLPLLKFIKNNGIFRIYVVIGMLLLISIQFNEMVKKKDISYLKKALQIGLILSVSLFMINLIVIVTNGFFTSFFSPQQSIVYQVKSFLSTANFSEKLAVDLVLKIFICSFSLLILRKKINPGFLLLIIMGTDIIIHNAINQPITGYQMKSPEYFESIIRSKPSKFEIPSDTYIGDFKNWNHLYLGDLNYYENNLSYNESNDYPTKFTSTDYLYQYEINRFQHRRYLYGMIDSISFSSSFYDGKSLMVQITSPIEQEICFFQNDYTGWKVSVNSTETPVRHNKNGLIIFPVPKGSSSVHIYFMNRPLLGITIAWILILITITVFYLNKRLPFSKSF